MHKHDRWICTCSCCATWKSPQQQYRGRLQTIKADYPLQVVAVDILTPFIEGKAGNSYIIAVGDYFTKWMEAYAITYKETVTVALRCSVDSYTPL